MRGLWVWRESPSPRFFALVLAFVLLIGVSACSTDNKPIRITIEELKERMDAGEQFFFVDARTGRQFAHAQTKLPGAVNVPVGTLDEHVDEIPRSLPIITYCRTA